MRLNRSSLAGTSGSVLLEVVLALVLFAAAATVIGIALNASIGSVERLRLGAHAADLSVTVFSELQAGIRGLTDSGQPGAGTNTWNVEIAARPWSGTSGQFGAGAASASSALTEVEVILRHESGFTYRSRQVLRLKKASSTSVAAVSAPGGTEALP